MMQAQEFFSTAIHDNQLSPLRMQEQIELSHDFYCDTHNKPHKEQKRQDAIGKFLKDVRRGIGQIDLSEHSITYLIDDGEFDFNQENHVVKIDGDSYPEMTISTSNVVGSMNLKGAQFNINCRFGNHFLAYMIASTSGFIELEQLGNISNHKGLGEWILLLYWKHALKHAFAKGIYKTYQKKQENLATVRGSIDINDWIKKRYFDGKVRCEFKEHSYDNNINKVISKAIDKVSRSIYSDLINDIYEIKRAFQGIRFDQMEYNFSDKEVSNPYYRNYNLVFELSKRILEDQFMSFASNSANFSAFLFDISLLFEHHIRKLIKKKYAIHPKDFSRFTVPNGVSQSKIYPDVIIDYGNNEIGVFDVKYKRFQTHGKQPGVKREDRFQLITYVAYYLNDYKVVNSGFIYPCEAQNYEALNAKIDGSQSIVVAGLEIPFGVYFYRVAKDTRLQHEYDHEFISSINYRIGIEYA